MKPFIYKCYFAGGFDYKIIKIFTRVMSFSLNLLKNVLFVSKGIQFHMIQMRGLETHPVILGPMFCSGGTDTRRSQQLKRIGLRVNLFKKKKYE